jgi:hypothetical protein
MPEAVEKNRQDYAARFGLSSERFVKEVFETAFLHVT